MKVEHESKSRTGSYMFPLASCYLSEGLRSLHILSPPSSKSPQSSEDAPLYPRSSQNRFTGFAKSIQRFLPPALGHVKRRRKKL